MKKFLPTLSFTFLFLGISLNTANANANANDTANNTTAKLPYDQCDSDGTSAYMQEFPNVKTFKKYYPNILAKGNSLTPPFYGTRHFNLACGGTALIGEVKISKKNQVSIETCGDLAIQTKEEACSTESKQYKHLMKNGKGTIFRDGKIFIFNKNSVTVTELYAPH